MAFFSTSIGQRKKKHNSFSNISNTSWKLSIGCQWLPNSFGRLTQNCECTFLHERSQLVGVLILQLLVFKSAILKSIQTLRESKKKLPGEYDMHFQECEYLKKFILKKKSKTFLFHLVLSFTLFCSWWITCISSFKSRLWLSCFREVFHSYLVGLGGESERIKSYYCYVVSHFEPFVDLTAGDFFEYSLNSSIILFWLTVSFNFNLNQWYVFCVYSLLVCRRSFKLFKYDVSSYPVSIHLPVTRFLSG